MVSQFEPLIATFAAPHNLSGDSNVGDPPLLTPEQTPVRIIVDSGFFGGKRI
jgi:hypothetical protein